MSDLEETGAIDYYLIEFRGKEINGELVPPLLDLVDRRLIRILDALILIKRADGSYDALTTEELDPSQVGELGPLKGASSGLLTDEDAADAAAALEPDSAGLLLVYENLWSVPFAVAARKAGGQVVASGRIPVQAILAQLDALEAEGKDT
jgi:Family of unknown function (DUF6325)